MRRKGFTLIELLVVIAIIGLLSTLSVVSLNSARGKARDATKRSDMNAINTAMELYNVDIGNYPVTAANCTTVVAGQSVVATTAGAVCSGNQIVGSSNDVIMQDLPTSQTDAYQAISGGTAAAANSFCISVLLEDDSTYFKCVKGSCFDTNAACSTNAG